MGNLRKFFQSMLSIMISISLCFPTATFTYATEDVSQGESYDIYNADMDSIDMDEFAPLLLDEEGEISNPNVRDAIDEEMRDPLNTDEFGAVFKILSTNASYWEVVDDPETPELEINLHVQDKNPKTLNTALRYTNGKNTMAYGMNAVNVIWPCDVLSPSGIIAEIGGDYWNASVDSPVTKLTLVNKRAWAQGEVIDGYTPIQFSVRTDKLKNGQDYIISPYYTILDKRTDMQEIKIHYTEDKSTYNTSVKSGRLSQSMGLPDNYKDYIWVNYNLNWSYIQEAAADANNKYYQIEIPEGVINQNGQKISGTYKINANEHPDSITTLTIGYPVETYNGETIEFKSDLYGTYKNETDSVKLAEAKIDGGIYLNHDDYDFVYDGELIGLSINPNDEEIYAEEGSELSENLGYRLNLISNLSRDNYLNNGTTADISIMYDFTDYMDKSGSYQDTPNTPTSLYVPANPFTDYKGTPITYNIEYDIIGFAQNNNEVLIGTYNTSESNNIEFNGEYDRIKMTIKNVTEPIATDSIYYNKDVNLEANSYRIETGYIRALVALDVVLHDIEGNIVHLTNDETISGSSYIGPGAERVKARDLEVYGYYLYRSFASTSVVETPPIATENYIRAYADEGYFHKYTNNTVYETSTFGFTQYTTTHTLGEIGIKKLNMTVDIPTFAVPRYEELFKIDVMEYETEDKTPITEDYLINHCQVSYRVVNGITKYQLNFDFSDNPIFPIKNSSFQLKIPTETPIYDHIQFGPTYSVGVDIEIPSDGWAGNWHTSQTDSAYDSREIVIDGASEQSILNLTTSSVMNNVYSMSGYTYKGSNYSWRPVVVTGGASLRNLTFFTVLSENDHEGSRLNNIDYSFMKSQGLNPTIKVIYNGSDQNLKDELMEERNFDDERWQDYDPARASEVYAIALKCNGILDSANATSFIINISNKESNDNDPNHTHTNNYFVQYEEANDMSTIVEKKELESAYAVMVLTDLKNSVKELNIIKKHDEEILLGAEFELLDEEGNVVASDLTADNDSKKITIKYLPLDGKFYLRETKAPIGYTLNSELIDLSGYFASASVDEQGNSESINVEVQNEKANANLVFYKVDALTGEPIEGVEFTAVERNTGFTKSALSGGDGRVVIEGLPQGKYSIRENNNVGGYLKWNNYIPVKSWMFNTITVSEATLSVDINPSVMDSNGDVYLLFNDTYYNGPFANTPYIPNWHKDFKLNIKLVNQYGAPFAGTAEFELRDPNGKLVKTSNYGTNGNDTIIINNGNASINFSAAVQETGFVEGTYTLKLISHDEESTTEFTEIPLLFNWDESNYTNAGDEITDEFLSHTIEIPFETSSKLATINKVDQDGNPVEGATFSITLAEAEETDGFVNYNPVAEPFTVTTDENGEAVFGMAAGAYIIEETTIPEGYAMSTHGDVDIKPWPENVVSAVNNWIAFTVDENYINNTDEINIKVTNNQIRPNVTITKYEELADGTKTTKPISGATFQIVDSNTGEPLTLERTTSLAGQVTFNNVKWGNWKVVETKPALGYYGGWESEEFTIDNANYSNNLSFTAYNRSNRSNMIVKTVDAVTGEPLAGVTLGIISNDQEVNEEMSNFSTGDNAYIDFDNVSAGDYAVQKIAVPEGYVIDENQEFTYLGAEASDEEKIIIVPIKRNVASVSVHKYDSLSELPISDAKFELFTKENGEWTSLGQHITDANGDFSINDLTWGEYYLTEIENEAYVIDEEPIYFTIDKTNAKGNETPMPLNNGEEDKGVSNDPITHNLTITKYAIENGVETDIPVEGAEFELLIGDRVIDTITTGENGVAVSNKLSYGDYTVREKTAPEGYEKAEDQTFIISRDNLQDKELIFYDERKPVSIKIIKKDSETDELLTDAEFDLLDKDDNLIKHVVIDNEEGVLVENLDWGVYKLCETKSPAGYNTNTQPQYIEVNGATSDNPKEVLVYNTKSLAVIAVTKYAKDNESNNTDKVLSGAEIGLYKDSGELLQSKITDDNGRALFGDISWGNYYIKEIKAPEKYQLNEEQQNITINAETFAEEKEINLELSMYDLPATARHTIKTIDADTGEPLEGVSFELRSELDNNIVEGETFTTSGDEASYITGDLYFGDYYLVETAVPKGYKLAEPNDVDHFSHTIAGGERIIPVERLKGEVTLIKYANDNDHNHTNNVLTGATFDLFKDNNGSEELIQSNLRVNKEGKINVEELDWGEYHFKETIAPDKYQLSNELFGFEINAENVEEEIIVSAYNDPSVSPVTVVTYDVETNELLPQCYVEINKIDGTNYRPSTATSGEDSSIVFNEVEFGEYYVSNVSVPEGYIVNTNRFEFTKSIESNTNTTIRIPIERKKGAITLTKVDATNNSPVEGASFMLTGKQLVTVGYEKLIKTEIAKTDSANEGDGISFSRLPAHTTTTKTVTIPGATQLKVKITHAEPYNGYMRYGASSPNNSISFSTTPKVDEVIVDGDTVVLSHYTGTFNGNWGFYAEITSEEDDLEKPIKELQENGEVILTTDEQGKITFEDLYWDEYKLKEVSNTGYILDDQIYTININSSNANGNENPIKVGGISGLIKNHRIPASISVAKYVRDFDGNTYMPIVPTKITDNTSDTSTGLLAWVEKDGIYQSKLNGNSSGTSNISFSFEAQVDGVLSFDWAKSSSTRGYGNCYIYKNNSLINTITFQNTDNQPNITDFEDIKNSFVNKTVGLTKGENYKITFQYNRSQAGYVSGLDSLFVKNIFFTPNDNFNKTGTEFALYKDGSTTIYKRLKVDENGIAAFDNVDWGTYQIKEINSPVGFSISEEIKTVTVGRDCLSVDEYFINSPKEASIEIHKIDSSSKKPLEGVNFILLASNKKDELARITTDSEGKAFINNLRWGEKYYLVETSTLKGYVLDTTEHEINLEAEDAENPKIIELNNDRELGTVILTKMSKDNTDIKLPGAEYSLYSSSGKLVREGLITDENGEIEVENLDWDNYFFLETKAPNGYSLSTERIRFSINENNCLATQKVAAYDEQGNISVTVNKKIKSSDVNFDNGNPTFTFSIKDNSGKYKKSGNVVFTSATPVDDEGYYNGSVVFDDLIVGETYTVEEYSSIRYQANDDVYTKSFTVTDENIASGITIDYVNDRIENSNYSESSGMLNIIKSKQSITGINAEWNNSPIFERPIAWDEFIHAYVVYDDGETKDINYNNGVEGWKINSITNKNNVAESYIEETLPDELVGNYIVNISYVYSGVEYTCDVEVSFTKPEIYAIYSADDNSLTFYNNIDRANIEEKLIGKYYEGKTVTKLYKNFDGKSYTSATSVPWNSVRTSIGKVEFADKMKFSQNTSFAYWFYNLRNSNFNSVDFSNVDCSNIIATKYMFYSNSYLKDISSLTLTDKLVDTSYMFDGCSSIESFDLTKLNLQSIINANSMFSGCSKLVSLNTVDLIMPNVNDVSSMFADCSVFEGFSGGVIIPKATNLSSMFYNCIHLTNAEITNDEATSLASMFQNCSNLEEFNFNYMNTSNVGQFSNMFYGCSSLAAVDTSNLDTSNATDCSMMFSFTKIEEFDFSSISMAKLENISAMLSGTNLINVDITPLTIYANKLNMDRLFENCQNLEHIIAPYGTDWSEGDYQIDHFYYNCTSLVGSNGTKYTDSYDYSQNKAVVDGHEGKKGYFTCYGPFPLYESAVLFEDGSLVFYNTALKTATIGKELDNKIVKNVYQNFTSAEELPWENSKEFITSVSVVDEGVSIVFVNKAFNNMPNCVSIDISKLSSNTNDLSGMFEGNSKLEELTLFNNTVDLSKVNNLSNMFKDCSSLRNVNSLNELNLGVIKYTTSMFENCSSLESIDISNLRTDIIEMGLMFKGCASLTNINQNLTTEKVSDFSYIFDGCSSLENIDIANWDTISATNMSYLFNGCDSLKNIDHNLFTYNVTTFESMFAGCSSLLTLNGGEEGKIELQFDINNLNNVKNMFNGCSSLIEIDLSYWDKKPTTSDENLEGMFNDCSNLEVIYVKPDTTWTVRGYNPSSINMFLNSNKLILRTELINYIYPTNYTNSAKTNANNGYGPLLTGKEGNYSRPLINKAVMYEGDSTLYFYNRQDKVKVGDEYDKGVIAKIYEVPTTVKTDAYGNITNYGITPDWYKDRLSIGAVSFEDEIHIINGMNLFYNHTNLKTIYNGEKLIFDKIITAYFMFNGCNNLTTIYSSKDWFDTSLPNYDSALNTYVYKRTENDNNSPVEFTGMFTGCGSLVGGAGTKVTTVPDYGYAAPWIRQAKIDGLNGNKGILTCTSLPMNKVAIYSATDNTLTFYNRADVLDMASGTYNNKDATLVFNNIDSYSRTYNTAATVVNNATKVIIADEMNIQHPSYMFKGLKNIIEIDGLHELTFDGAEEAKEMFSGCTNLTTIYADEECSLNEIPDSADMFKDCNNLIGQAGTNYTKTPGSKTYYSEIWDEANYGKVSNSPNYRYYTDPETGRSFNDCSYSYDMYYQSSDFGDIYRYPVDANVWPEAVDGYLYFTIESLGNMNFNIYLYQSSYDDSSRAIIDGLNGQPGYFTDVNPTLLNNVAIYSDTDNSLTYYNNSDFVKVGMNYNGKNVKYIFKNINNTRYDFTNLGINSVFINDNMVIDSPSYMFRGLRDCGSFKGLTKLSFKDNDFTSMFEGCSSIVELDISNFSINLDANAKSENMFKNCFSLETIYVDINNTFNNIAPENSKNMFGGCINLEGQNGTKTNITQTPKIIWDSSTESITTSIYYPYNIYANGVFLTNNGGSSLSIQSKSTSAGRVYRWAYSGSQYSESDGYIYTTTAPENYNDWYTTVSAAEDSNSSSLNSTKALIDGVQGIGYFSCEGPYSLEKAIVKFEDGSVSVYNRNEEVTIGGEYEGKIITKISTNFNGGYITTDNDSYSVIANFIGGANVITFEDEITLNPERLFYKANTIEDINGLDKVTYSSDNFSYMFSETAIKSLNIDKVNGVDSPQANIKNMFYNCSELISIFTSNENKSLNNNEDYVFEGCVSLVGGNGTTYSQHHLSALYARVDKSGQVGYFTFSGTYELNNQFVYSSDDNSITFYNRPGEFVTLGEEYNDKSVSVLYSIEELHTKASKTKATNITIEDELISENLANLFSSMSNVISIDKIYNINTSQATSLSGVFQNCSSLKSIDLSGWNVVISPSNSNVKGKINNISNMFYNCSKLERIYVDNDDFSLANAYQRSNTFYGCYNLKGQETSRYGYGDDIYIQQNGDYAEVDGAKHVDDYGSISYSSGFFTNKKPMLNHIAIYSEDDDSLSFYNNGDQVEIGGTYRNKTVTMIYSYLRLSKLSYSNSYEMSNYVPWEDVKTSIKNVYFKNNVVLSNMSNWFSGTTSCKTIDMSKVTTQPLSNQILMTNAFSGSSVKTIYASSRFVVNGTDENGRNEQVFNDCTKLIGGKGTKYNSANVNINYAHIDEGTSNPGYFTIYDGPIDAYGTAVYSEDDGKLIIYNREGEIEKGKYFDGRLVTNVVVINDGNNMTYQLTEEEISNIKEVSFADKYSVINIDNLFSNLVNCEVVDLTNFDASHLESYRGCFSNMPNLEKIYTDDINSWPNIENNDPGFNSSKLKGALGIRVSYTNNETLSPRGIFTYLKEEYPLQQMMIYSADDNSLTLYDNNDVVNVGDLYNGKTVSAVVPYNLDNGGDLLVGNENKNSIVRASIVDPIEPISTKYWFHNFIQLQSVDARNILSGNLQDSSAMFSNCISLRTIYSDNNADWSSIKISTNMFYNCNKIKGGNGTTYNNAYVDSTRAKVDKEGSEGYFSTSSVVLTNAAIYSTQDNSLTFYNNTDSVSVGDVYNGKSVDEIFTGYINGYGNSSINSHYDYSTNTTIYRANTNNPWHDLNIEKVSGELNVNDARSMFAGMANLKDVDITINSNGQLNMAYMFTCCTKLIQIDLRGSNDIIAGDISNMFTHNSSLCTIFVDEGEDWTSTASGQSPFLSCANLKGDGDSYANSYDYSTSKATVNGYFTSIIPQMNLLGGVGVYSGDDDTLRIYNRDVNLVVGDIYEGHKVTSIRRLEPSAWREDSVIKHIKIIDKVNAGHSLNGTFREMSSLIDADLSNLDVSNTSDFGDMFWRSSNLEEINISNWVFNDITNASFMFSQCNSLRTIYTNPDTDWTGNIATYLVQAGAFGNEYVPLNNLRGGNGTYWNYAGLNNLLRVDGLNGKPGIFTAAKAENSGETKQASYKAEIYFNGVLFKTINELGMKGNVGDSIVFEAPEYEGYQLTKVSPAKLILKEDEGKNVFKLYYNSTTTYTVETYLDGVLDTSKTKIFPAKIGRIVTYNLPEIDNYYTKENKISQLIDSEGKVLRADYYKKNSYKINIYVDGILDDSLSQEFKFTNKPGDIVDVVAPELPGLLFDSKDKDNIIIVDNDELNIANIYYVKGYGYKVNYYYDNIHNKSKDTQVTTLRKAGTTVNYLAGGYETGYRLVNYPASLVLSNNESENVVKVHYIPDNDFGGVPDGDTPSSFKFDVGNPSWQGQTVITENQCDGLAQGVYGNKFKYNNTNKYITKVNTNTIASRNSAYRFRVDISNSGTNTLKLSYKTTNVTIKPNITLYKWDVANRKWILKNNINYAPSRANTWYSITNTALFKEPGYYCIGFGEYSTNITGKGSVTFNLGSLKLTNSSSGVLFDGSKDL